MRSLSRSIPSLVLVLAVGASGAARAAECPDPRPVAGAFRAVQVSPGTVVTYPPAGATVTNAGAAEIQRGVTLSGVITGLDGAASNTEMGLTLQLDLVRYLKTG